MKKSIAATFPPYQAFYIDSLLSCTSSALISAQWVSEFLSRYPTARDQEDPRAVLNHLQNIALQGAAISRFFWPSHAKYESRGRDLRRCFRLDDTNPLRSRALRNRMEHYDEYLDDYLEGGSVFGRIIPDYVGPEPRNEEIPYHLFRAFFVDTGRVSILGVAFELQPLADAVRDLHEVLLRCEQEGSCFPRLSTEPDAPPNGGPATPQSNSEVGEGPPSVS
jgi:hypothetical protein